jgi:1,4-dihydroxy-2-naphthoate octaprenyltransferase
MPDIPQEPHPSTPTTNHQPPTTAAVWLLATRPKTLLAGVVPVAVGTSLAALKGQVHWDAAAACLVGSLLIQIGCNFANDAFDGLKGADTPDRLGPQRAVAAGLITPRAMLAATAVVLALAFAVGLYLTTFGGWPILVLGCISLVCAVAYTAGPFPLAYVGLGDLFVLLFFGFFAVLGTLWVQQPVWPFPLLAWLVAATVGLQATAIIAVNNLRDIPTDARVGKRTLAVRLGDRLTRRYYLSLHVGAGGCLLAAWILGGPANLWLPATIALVGGMALSSGVARTRGAGLNVYLARTAALELATGAAIVGACRF